LPVPVRRQAVPYGGPDIVVVNVNGQTTSDQFLVIHQARCSIRDTRALFRERRRMMKTLTCRGVGVDCDFVAQGQTEQEVPEKARQHARQDHGFSDIPPELEDKVKAAIRDKETTAA
jgi:predicted small metal-binding protein